MKKSKIKKLLAKELAQYESRITHIEREIAPKLDAPASIQPHFDEVTEGLPEKFAIHCRDLTNEQRDFLSENIINSRSNTFLNTEYSYYHFNNRTTVDNGGNEVDKGYQLITFETFKKYVLKEEVKESVELEVNRWYKNQHGILACYSGMLSGYKVDGSPISMTHSPNWTPATESEVFEALKAEACKQYKVGQTVFDNWSNCKITLNDLTRFDYSNGNLFVLNLNNSKTHLLGSNGQWATIIPQPEPIDFSKAGQLVKSKDGKVLLYTTDETPKDEDDFSGTVLESDIYKKGHTCNNWSIKMFTLCTEPVTLKNE